MSQVWQPWRVHPLLKCFGVLAGLGVAAVGYGATYEVRAFTLRRLELPVLPPDSRSLKVLHISDLHLTPSQHGKRRWVRDLASLEPDLVVNSGDNLAHPAAVPTALDALHPLLDVPGVFVLGSNDYYAPILKNPARYLLPSGPDKRRLGAPLPWRDLRDAFVARGWLDLSNRIDTLKVQDSTIGFAGVDDPHLRYDNLAAVAGPANPDADLRIGVSHAPYLRVLDQFCSDGYETILAGHTHGGQLCLPFGRALVTNCDLDTARVKGLHHHDLGTRGWSALHVSAGLGTSPYAPVRLFCRPEASLITFTPMPD